MALSVALNGMFWGLEHTGSGQYLHRLLPYLAAEVDLTLCTPVAAATGHGDAGGEAPAGNRRALPTPFDGRNANLAKVWFEQLSFPRACRTLGVGVGHVPYFAPPLRPPVPTVTTVHDLIPLLLPAYRGHLGVRGYTALVARAARRARVVLTDSEASARDIVRHLGLPERRVRVAYLAADPRYRPLSKEERREVAVRLSLPERYLLYLGGFDRRKNVPEILAAYACSCEALDGLSLVLAGRLPDRDSAFTPDPRPIAARLGIEGRVHLTGWVTEEDKPALYAGASAFLFPSTYEGFGLPVLEAISCGAPAIVGAGSSLEEVAGPGGLAVSPGDVPALAEAMTRLVREPALRAEMREAGLAHAHRFSWARTAVQTLEAYDEAARGEP